MGKQYELKDVLKYRPKIAEAEGRFCIELTDPITGKVLERVKEHNRIFEDMLFGYVISSEYLYDWQVNISYAWLLLTDSEKEITPDTTFLFGNLIGYGQPNSAGYGSRRGAYVADAQQLAIADTEKVHWKFQYEFTASQAVGKIATIGLSHQFSSSMIITPASRFKINNPLGETSGINDGEFIWNIATSGGTVVVNRRKVVEGNNAPAQTFIPADLAYEGQNLSRSLGYNPITKRFYIYTYKTSSPQERILQEYSDGTFSNLIQTRTLAINWFSTYNFYIYGNYMIAPATDYISVFNYVTGGDEIPIYPDAKFVNDNNDWGEWGFALATPTFSVNHIPVGRYLYLLGTTTSAIPRPMGAIFDMETFEFVSYYATLGKSSGGGSYAPLIYPIGDRKLLVRPQSIAEYYLGINGVLTAKKLDTPVVKPDNRGMIVSYELDVYW